MPRRPPNRVRAELRLRHRTRSGRRTVIDGLSPAALAEVARAETPRKDLWQGGTAEALRLWRDFVRDPRRRGEEIEGRCLAWACCGDPFEARDFLEDVMLAVSRRARRQLRALVDPLDDRY